MLSNNDHISLDRIIEIAKDNRELIEPELGKETVVRFNSFNFEFEFDHKKYESIVPIMLIDISNWGEFLNTLADEISLYNTKVLKLNDKNERFNYINMSIFGEVSIKDLPKYCFDYNLTQYFLTVHNYFTVSDYVFDYIFDRISFLDTILNNSYVSTINDMTTNEHCLKLFENKIDIEQAKLMVEDDHFIIPGDNFNSVLRLNSLLNLFICFDIELPELSEDTKKNAKF